MATIFRPAVFARTSLAVLSTVVAINAQPIQNRLLLQPPPRSNKDYPSPARPKPKPYVLEGERNRLLFDPVPPPPPRSTKEWPSPARPNPPPFVADIQRFTFATISPIMPAVDWQPAKSPPRALIADAILNPTAFLLKATGQPFSIDDWPQPAFTLQRPFGLFHLRQQAVAPTAPPFFETAWARPATITPKIVVEYVCDQVLFPSPVIVPPFRQNEWPAPTKGQPAPYTHLFYYMQDQTVPVFLPMDWPKAPKRPSITADPIPNRLVLPTPVVLAPFRQNDWPNASIRRPVLITDPFNRSIFLPPPVGLPTHQYDWPLPQGAKPLQGSHTVNDLGILTTPVARPVRPIEWPNPKAVLLTVMWEREGQQLLYLPRFQAEWAVNANQVIGPWAPQAETH